MQPTADSLRTGARRETARFLKFLVVGAAAFVVDTGSLSFFALVLTLPPIWSKALSFTLAVAASFFGNQWWAYRDSRGKPLRQQVLSFTAISLVGLLINLGAFALARWLCLELVGPVVALYIAQVSAVGAAMVWNFGANRLITYNDIALGR